MDKGKNKERIDIVNYHFTSGIDVSYYLTGSFKGFEIGSPLQDKLKDIISFMKVAPDHFPFNNKNKSYQEITENYKLNIHSNHSFVNFKITNTLSVNSIPVFIKDDSSIIDARVQGGGIKDKSISPSNRLKVNNLFDVGRFSYPTSASKSILISTPRELTLEEENNLHNIVNTVVSAGTHIIISNY